MKSKISLVAIAVIVFVSTVVVAHAQNSVADLDGTANITVDAQTTINKGANVQASTSASATVRGKATSTATKNNRATSTVTSDEHPLSTADSEGKFTSETHRSIVATFVHALLAVANREGGIGAQVRAVAQSQNDSASTTANAMAKVDARGSFHTFLAGSDYKNLGVIRSEIATTSANIARLKAVLTKTSSTANRTELSTQIHALEDEEVKIDAYVKANEDKFSLFGWFSKLFVK